MKGWILIFVLTITSVSNAQESNRIVRYADLRDPQNKPFYRRDSHIPGLIFSGIWSGEIVPLQFQLNEDNRKRISFEELQERLEIRSKDYYKWDAYKFYHKGSQVRWNNVLFESLEDGNIGNQPDSVPEYWLAISYYLKNKERKKSYEVKQDHQIPINPNEVDAEGRKTGNWTILFDEDWNEIENLKEAEFYRLIAYKEGKPTGKMGDYYRNGQIQMEATVISENPETYDGEVIFYSEEGDITDYRYYINGRSLRYSSKMDYYLPKEICKIEFDYSIDANGGKLEFLHLSIPNDISVSGEDKYIVSVDAEEAIDIINGTQYLWYKDNFLGEVAPDLFLGSGLKSGLYAFPFVSGLTELVNSNPEVFDKYFKTFDFTKSFSAFKYLGNEADEALIIEYTEVLGRIPLSIIRDYSPIPRPEFYLLGDALQIPDKIHFNATNDNLPNTTSSSLDDPTPVNTITTFVRERISIESTRSWNWLITEDIMQSFENEELKAIQEFIDEIYEGLAKNKLITYVNDSLVQEQSNNTFVTRTMFYEAGGDDDFDDRSELLEVYQPQDVQLLELKYEMIFSANGRISEKTLHSIGLLIPGNISVEGINKYLGFLKIKDIEKYQEMYPKSKETIDKALTILKEPKQHIGNIFFYYDLRKYQ